MAVPKHRIMWNQMLQLSPDGEESLQAQIRTNFVRAILDGLIPVNHALPSSRELSRQLGVSRNTVMFAYQHLIDGGYLIARERRGYFVNPDILDGRVGVRPGESATTRSQATWVNELLQRQPSIQRNIEKDPLWRRYPYPFIYGQMDPDLIPINEWRECVRQSLSVSEIRNWAADRFDADDPLLVREIQQLVLPRRGIWVNEDQILITLGAQHALYLISSLLVGVDTMVGMENPGYPDIRNIFQLRTDRVKALAIDQQGVKVDSSLSDCDLVYVTPSHQFPTTVTLPMDRRKALLHHAVESNYVIIEDDYEAETNYVGEPTAALKSIDSSDRVIYVGSLSKTLAPGLRLGFLVAPTAFIHEARALRRLMLRHPPANNQRAVALFLNRGHHDALISRLHQIYQRRWQVMGEALALYLPDASRVPTFGGTSYWVSGPTGLDSRLLCGLLAEHEVLIEPGDIYFHPPVIPTNTFRLGFSSIPVDRIETGIRIIAEFIDRCCRA